jgi:hypothetical protein
MMELRELDEQVNRFLRGNNVKKSHISKRYLHFRRKGNDHRPHSSSCLRSLSSQLPPNETSDKQELSCLPFWENL